MKSTFEIALAVVENGYLNDDLNFFGGGKVDYNAIEADLYIDGVVNNDYSDEVLYGAYDLLEECIEEFSKKALH